MNTALALMIEEMRVAARLGVNISGFPNVAAHFMRSDENKSITHA
jgi:hypothetical protein